MNNMFPNVNGIQLGHIYQDNLTGFQGVASSATQYLFACVRVGLTPITLIDGKIQEIQVFDQHQLKWIGEHAPLADQVRAQNEQFSVEDRVSNALATIKHLMPDNNYDFYRGKIVDGIKRGLEQAGDDGLPPGGPGDINPLPKDIKR